jgi:hypothetical protein
VFDSWQRKASALKAHSFRVVCLRPGSRRLTVVYDGGLIAPAYFAFTLELEDRDWSRLAATCLTADGKLYFLDYFQSVVREPPPPLGRRVFCLLSWSRVWRGAKRVNRFLSKWWMLWPTYGLYSDGETCTQ